MARLRMMRAPQKYVQGKDSLFKFHEEMKDLGNKFLFVCSRSGYKMCHDKIEKSFEGTEDIRQVVQPLIQQKLLLIMKNFRW